MNLTIAYISKSFAKEIKRPKRPFINKRTEMKRNEKKWKKMKRNEKKWNKKKWKEKKRNEKKKMKRKKMKRKGKKRKEMKTKENKRNQKIRRMERFWLKKALASYDVMESGFSVDF